MRHVLRVLSLALALPAGAGSAHAQDEKEPTYQGMTVSAWIKQLETSTSESQRNYAIEALGKMGPATKEVLPALVKAVEDRAPSVRFNALMAIQDLELPAKDAAPVFLKLAQSKDETVRATAVAVLGDMDPETKDVLPALINALDDRSYKVSGNAVKALREMELATPDAIAFFTKAMGKSGQQEAGFAVLARLGPSARKEALPGMVKLLDKPEISSDYRHRVLLVLGEMGPEAKEAVPDLLRLLRGRDTGLRLSLVVALGQIGPDAKEAVPDLVAAVEDKDTGLQFVAIKSLGQIGQATPEAIAAVGKFLGPDAGTRREPAADTLKKFGAPAAPTVVEAFKSYKNNPRDLILLAELFAGWAPRSREPCRFCETP